jgi:hypothetical protein
MVDGTMAPVMGVNGFLPNVFVDLTKSSRFYWLDRTHGKTPLPVDDEGWPTVDCGFSFADGENWDYRSGHAPNLSGSYTISFQCDNPQVEVAAGTRKEVITKTGYDPATKTWTGTLAVPQSVGVKHCGLDLRFTNTQTGIRRLRFLRPGYDLSTRETEVYAPFKTAIVPFGGIFRLASDQGGGTKPYPAMRAWATRIDPPYMPAPLGQNQDGMTDAEWQVILANELDRDLWFEIPVNATDDYVEHVARAVKDGSTYRGRTFPPLRRDLKLYVEYSNEVWNFGFYQFVWNLHAARAGFLQGNLDAPHTWKREEPGRMDVGFAWRYAGRAAEISRIFRRVFGDEQMMSRVRPILSWQMSNGSTPQAMGEFIAQFYGPPETLFYAVGDAPYVNPRGDTPQSMYQQTVDILDRYAKQHWRQSVAGARSVGLRYVCYEGGGFTAYTRPAKQCQFDWLYDPRIKDLTKRYWLDFAAAGGTELTWTGFYGPAVENGGGAWGIVEDFFHPQESPRWVAVKELSTMPRPAVQAAATVNGRGPSIINLPSYQFTVEPDSPTDRLKDRQGRLYHSQPLPRQTLCVNVAKPGLYAVTLTGSHLAPGSDHSLVRVRIDGRAACDLSLPRGGNPGNDTDWANSSTTGVVSLDAGLHALQLRCDPAPRNGRKVQDLIIAPAAALPKLAPSAPAVVKLYPQEGRILVAWEAATDHGRPLLGYNLYRGGPAGGETLYKKGLPPTLISFLDAGLKTGETFSYRITAVNEIGEGAPSPSASASPVEKPAAPTGLKAELSKGPEPGTAAVTLSWDPPADNVNCYVLYFSRQSGAEPAEPVQFWIGVTGNRYDFISDRHPFIRDGVKARDLYFQLSAVNGAGQGPRCGELHVDTRPILDPKR